MPSNKSNARKKLQFYQSLTSPEKIRQVELFEQTTFDFWSRKTWVKFIYVYANNDFNKKHGRVGRISGFRIGTRNLDLIPTEHKPRTRGNSKVKRYYDVTRAEAAVEAGISSGGLRGRVMGNGAQQGQWRSFRPESFSIMVELWSFEKEMWVDKIEDFVNRKQNSG